MEEFRIHEISAVDHPAQEGAKMAIMKRRGGDQLVQIAQVIADRYVAKQALPQELTNVLTAKYGDLGDFEPAVLAFETVVSNGTDGIAAAKAVNEFLVVASEKWNDLPAVLSDAFGVAAQKGEAEMKIEELTTKVAALPKEAIALTKDGKPGFDATLKSLADEVKAVTDIEKRDALQKDLDSVAAYLAKAWPPKEEEEEDEEMSDEEEAWMEEELEDEDEKKKFRSMPAEERKTAMAKKAADKAEIEKNEETLTIAGRTIHKSKVGEDAFAVFKAQAEQLAKANDEIAKERDRREMVELTKRAEDELSHLPGETAAKAKVLKAVGTMSKEDREVLEGMLKAGEKAIKMAFNTLGHKVGKSEGDPNAFQKRVSEIASRDKCSKTEAMQKARAEYPEEFKAYQAAN
jgi:hypothetical protein